MSDLQMRPAYIYETRILTPQLVVLRCVHSDAPALGRPRLGRLPETSPATMSGLTEAARQRPRCLRQQS